MGYYIWVCTNNWLCYFVDVKLFGMTLHERFNVIQTECGNCKIPINQWAQTKDIREAKSYVDPDAMFAKSKDSDQSDPTGPYKKVDSGAKIHAFKETETEED